MALALYELCLWVEGHEDATDRARENGALGCCLMSVARWAAEHADEEAYVLDRGSRGQGEDRSAFIWWATRVVAAEER